MFDLLDRWSPMDQVLLAWTLRCTGRSVPGARCAEWCLDRRWNHQNPSEAIKDPCEKYWTPSNIIKHHETSLKHQESQDFSQIFSRFSIHFPPRPTPRCPPGCRRGTEAFPVALHHSVNAPQLLHGGRSIVAGPRGVVGFNMAIYLLI